MTYEYDDNFEMTEIQTIQKLKVPEIYFSLKSDGVMMTRYLKNQNIIKPDTTINREVFPLYTLKTFTETQYLGFSTSNTFKNSLTVKNSDYFFSAYINFDTLIDTGFLESEKKDIKKIKKLQIQAKKTEQKGIIVNGYIQFENRATKDLLDLF